MFKLSRELGHSSVKITADAYLGDFKSSDARQDHNERSAINNVKLGRMKGDKRKKNID